VPRPWLKPRAADFTLSGKTTRVGLDTNENLALFQTRLSRHDGFRPKRTPGNSRIAFFDSATKELLPPVTGGNDSAR